jgi:CBS domain-containing protein
MKVKDAMHKGVEWVEPQTSLADVAKKMRKHDIGSIPVGENDRLVGMVTDRDIVLKGLVNSGDLSKMSAGDVMTKGIIYCRDNENLDDAIRIMEKKQVRRLPVINGKKKMVGMLSLGDVSNVAPGELSSELVCAVSAHHA